MITIITSLYKSEKYLKRFLQKLTFVDIDLSRNNIDHEFLIISNSTNSKEKRILDVKKDANIKILFCEREPLYATWNRGIRESKYNIFCFWNVDDVRFSEAIIDGINKIKDKNADIVYFPFVYKRYVNIFDIKILIKKKIIDPPEFVYKNFAKEMHCGPFFMTTKKSIEKNGFFDEEMKISGDFDWCVRAVKSNLIFIKCSTVAGIFTNDGTSLSGSKNVLQQKENTIILNKK